MSTPRTRSLEAEAARNALRRFELSEYGNPENAHKLAVRKRLNLTEKIENEEFARDGKAELDRLTADELAVLKAAEKKREEIETATRCLFLEALTPSVAGEPVAWNFRIKDEETGKWTPTCREIIMNEPITWDERDALTNPREAMRKLAERFDSLTFSWRIDRAEIDSKYRGRHNRHFGFEFTLHKNCDRCVKFGE